MPANGNVLTSVESSGRSASAFRHSENSAWSDVTTSAASKLPNGYAPLVSTFLKLKRRQIIFRDGSQTEGVFEVIEGTAFLFKHISDGRRQILHVLREGALLNSATDGKHTYSAETLTPLKLRVYQKAFAETSQEILRRWRDQVFARAEALQTRALLLGRKTAMERVASFYLEAPGFQMHNMSSAPLAGDTKLVNPLKQRDIADYLGLQIETVNRNIAKLEHLKIIQTGTGGKVDILDAEGLRLRS